MSELVGDLDTYGGQIVEKGLRGVQVRDQFRVQGEGTMVYEGRQIAREGTEKVPLRSL